MIVDVHSRAGSAKAVVRNPKNYIQNIWRKGKFFEDRTLEYIYWHYKRRVFVDVGSCFGNHALFFAAFCEPNHVVSVEPVAGAVDLQREVLKVNGLERRVTIHQVAVSDEPGRGRMEPWDDRYPFASCRLLPGDEVEVTTLDSLLADVRHINLIKIDVENSEIAVLRGGWETIKRWHPALFLEFRTKPNYRQAKEMLGELGYEQRGSYFQDSTLIEFT